MGVMASDERKAKRNLRKREKEILVRTERCRKSINPCAGEEAEGKKKKGRDCSWSLSFKQLEIGSKGRESLS